MQPQEEHSASTKTAESLLHQLRSVFPAAPCAEPATTGTDDTFLTINRYLHAKHWCEIDQSFVREFDQALDLMNDRAFHRFLPAWLLFAIEDPLSVLAWSVVLCLEETRSTALFDEPQRHLVREIAVFLLDHGVLDHGCAQGESDSARLNIQRVWGPCHTAIGTRRL